MKLNKFKYSILLILFVALTPLEANYCIQVLSMHEKNKNFIIKEAKSVNYAAFPKVRVEQRGHYLTFRIGDYPHYRNARKDIALIRRMHSGAYVRKCEIQPENIVYMQREDDAYIPDEKPVHKIQRRERPVSIIIPDPIYEEKVVRTKKHLYKKPQELHYKKSSSFKQSDYGSLWDECKRCFAPVYEEESSETQEYPTEALPSKIVPRHKSEEIEVNVQSTDDSSNDSFWSQDTDKRKTIKRNVYNIDERYLP